MSDTGLPPASWAPRDSFGGLVLEAAALLRKATAQAMAEAGQESLSFSRVGVLIALEEEHTLADLSKRLRLQPPSLLELMNKMKREGLLGSKPSTEDRRKVLWKRTRQGTQALASARAVLRQVGERIDRYFAERSIASAEVERVKSLLKDFTEGFTRSSPPA